MRKKSYAYNIVRQLPHFKQGGYLDMYLQQFDGGGAVAPMKPINSAQVNIPMQTTAPKINKVQQGAFPSEINSNNFNYGNAALSGLGALGQGISTYAQTGQAGTAVKGVADTAIGTISPVAGAINQAGNILGNWAKSDYQSTDKFGNFSNPEKTETATEIGFYINPLDRLASGLNGEGWTGSQVTAKRNAKTKPQREAYEKQLATQYHQREVNAGYGGNYWNENQMMQAAYGGSLPVIGESYEMGGPISRRYGYTRNDLVPMSNYNSGVDIMKDGGKLNNNTQTLPPATISGISTRQQAYNDSLALYDMGEKNYIENRHNFLNDYKYPDYKYSEFTVLNPYSDWFAKDKNTLAAIKVYHIDPSIINLSKKSGIKPIKNVLFRAINNKSYKGGVEEEEGYYPRFKKPTSPITSKELTQTKDINLKQQFPKKSFHNSLEYPINRIQSKDAPIPSEQSSDKTMKPVPNGWRQPLPGYGGMEVEFSQDGKPMYIYDAKGNRQEYGDGIPRFAKKEFGGELERQQMQPRGSTVTEYDGDMSHASNPQGGTAVDSQGNRIVTSNNRPVALVEGNEVSFYSKSKGLSYIFSDKIPYEKK